MIEHAIQNKRSFTLSEIILTNISPSAILNHE